MSESFDRLVLSLEQLLRAASLNVDEADVSFIGSYARLRLLRSGEEHVLRVLTSGDLPCLVPTEDREFGFYGHCGTGTILIGAPHDIFADGWAGYVLELPENLVGYCRARCLRIPARERSLN